MAQRTDIHRPAVVITEDYDFVGCGDFGSSGEPGYSPLTSGLGRLLLDQGARFADVESNGCQHCGARLRFYAILHHPQTNTFLRVGEQCLDNRFSLASQEFHGLRRAAKLNRDRVKLTEKRDAWLAKGQNGEAFEWASAQVAEGDYGYEGMVFNFVHKVNRYGETSEKFVQAILRQRQFKVEREQRKVIEEATLTDVIEGRGEVTGEVLTLKWQDNAYGGALKMLVKDDRGFKLWGTVPRAIDQHAERGSRVKFVATVEAKPGEKGFGFFSRPTKAEVI